MAQTKSDVGPLRWMSPESLSNRIYSPKRDIWSFGSIIYEIVSRKEPHSDIDNQIELADQIRFK